MKDNEKAKMPTKPRCPRKLKKILNKWLGFEYENGTMETFTYYQVQKRKGFFYWPIERKIA